MNYSAQTCARCRADFPALTRRHKGFPIAYLDGPGGTQVPETVLATIREAYIERNANFDGAFATSIAVTKNLAEARTAAADFLGAADAGQISFGANMTTLNFSLSRALGRSMKPGDEVVITELDHEANRGPWLKLREYGIVLREVRLLPDGRSDPDDFVNKINERTRVVAVGMASNSLGTVTGIGAIRRLCGNVGAKLVVDAVHYAAHFPLDVIALDVDFLLCSAYKFYGPHVGILYSRAGLLDTLDTDHLRTQKSIAPYRIETGTLNHAAIAGVTAAIDYIASWGDGANRREKILDAMRAIHDYELDLAADYYARAKRLPRVTVWGPDFNEPARAPTVSLSIDGLEPERIAAHLAGSAVQVWHGHFYALKVLEVLGLVEQGGLMRVGISMYNTRQEIDRLIAGMNELIAESK